MKSEALKSSELRLFLGRVTIIAFITLLASFSRAESPYLKADEMPSELRFGSEMTLSSDELRKSYPVTGWVVNVESDYARDMVAKFRENILESYDARKEYPPLIEDKSSHSRWRRSAFKLTYPNEFELTVFADPGVLEMNSSPSSQKVIEQNLKVIQRDYFDEGKKLGLEPAAFTGSGHIHIEVSKLHPITIRNFLADFFNTPGLAAGALNEDIYNAIGVGEIPDANKLLLRQAFQAFDDLAKPELTDIPDLVDKAYRINYNNDLLEYRKARKESRSTKYFSVSFRSFDDIGTIEIRSIRPQASAESYLKLVKLFTLRMQLAEKNRKRGYVQPIGRLQSVRGQPQKILMQFSRYLTEVGLSLEDYREFVLPWWNTPGGEVDKFLAERKKNSRLKNCREFLEPKA